jgi:3-oxoacyl-[acyl-carrier protein] reductase
MTRVALVTGASGGIGGAVARSLGSDGVSVACLGHRNISSAELVAKEIEQQGGTAAAFAVDVADEASIERAADEVAAWAGPPGIVVNAAGVVRDGLAVRYPTEDLRAVLDVNLTGAFLMTRAALRGMLRARWGRIINVASVAGLMGNPGQTAYSASKAGVIGMTRSLARELGSRGITVNAVCPGLIDTEIAAGMTQKGMDGLLTATPAGRAGRPEEVAAVVRFLASEEAAYVNGAVVTIDGGLSA